jgi:hypothetical protein
VRTIDRQLPVTRGEDRTPVGEDQLDVALEDAELLAEVELTTDLMIAGSQSDQPLSQSAVDGLLGLGGVDYSP